MLKGQAQWLWEATLGRLQLQVSRPSYETWLKETIGLTLTDDTLLVSTPSTFAAEWLEQRMYHLIQTTVEDVAGHPLEVRFRVCQADGEGPPPDSPSRDTPDTPVARADQQDANSNGKPSSLILSQPSNPRYTFDFFVVGKGSQLAYAAAQAVAAYPGISYNPLFLYAGVGLGKTHLLHAIAHQVAHRGLSFLYVTTEQFTNDFISAIRNRSTEQFRTKYRSVDVLLIDDIHFISGKEQTQEGFFHTFNDLHNVNRQIVITSDRPPKALALLEERLRSRFEWGLIADIQPPDLETRLAILRFKAEQAQLDSQNGTLDAVLEFIARKVQKNIRELEGSLTRVIAFAQLTNSPITPELTARALANVLQEDHLRAISPQKVFDTVAAYYRVSTEALTGKRRDKKTALARQVAMYLLREGAHRPLQEIGHLVGDRDHTTVLYAVRKIHQEIESIDSLRQDVLSLREQLLAPAAP